MQFEIKHRCPYCNQAPTDKTPYDHFLQCKSIRTKKKSTSQKIITILIITTYSLHPKKQIIINNVSKYYNNITENNYHLINTDSENKDKILKVHSSITNQNIIGWGHFIRGRISKALYAQIKQYYNQNKLGKSFRYQFWINWLINFTLTLHAEEWR